MYYVSGVLLSIIFDDIDWNDVSWGSEHTGCSFGFFVCDDKEILLKKEVDIGEAINTEYFFDEGNALPRIYCEFTGYEVPGIDHDVMRKLGVYNLTAVNFADGTSDTVLFNVSKFYPYLDGINCVVNKTNVTFYLYYLLFPVVYVSVDDISYFFSSKYDELKVTFVNLKPGAHVMKVYSPVTDFSEEFSYNLTFKINKNNNMDNLPVIEFYDNSTGFNFFDRYNVTILSWYSLNSNYGKLKFNMINKSDLKSHEGVNSYDESVSAGDDDSGGSYSRAGVKCYEISKKSVSKSKDDLITKLGLSIVSCMLFMFGYIRFEKNK